MARKPLDAYETPEYFVKVLRAAVPFRPEDRVIEPCAGDNAIARLFPGCITNDIDTGRDTLLHGDATTKKFWEGAPLAIWCVTNPPFRSAAHILEHALNYVGNVAMILRISFLEPTKDREPLVCCFPPQGLIYLPRYSFTQNGKTDMATVAWHIWSTDPGVLHALQQQPIRVAERFTA